MTKVPNSDWIFGKDKYRRLYGRSSVFTSGCSSPRQSNMQKDPIHFIRHIPQWKSRREQELVRAQALSHAARISAQRRKSKKKSQEAVLIQIREIPTSDILDPYGPEYGPTLIIQDQECPPKERGSIYPLSWRPRYRSEEQRNFGITRSDGSNTSGHDRRSLDIEARQSPPVWWCTSTIPDSSIAPTILDSIPTTEKPLTYLEKTTLWNYFSFVPAAAYGTSGSGPFCVFRDLSFPNCQQYPQALQWMLIAAERHTAIRSLLPEPQSLLHRKAGAYRAIGRLLQDDLVRTDEALVVIIGAIVIESRFLDVEVTRMHLRGLESLIQHRGGLPSLFQSTAVMHHPLFLIGYMTSVPLVIESQEQLDNHKATFDKTLKNICMWNRQLRRLFSEGTHIATTTQDLQSSIGYQTNPHSPLKEYMEARNQSLNSLSLKPYITLPSGPVKETFWTRTCRFTVFYLIDLFLWRYMHTSPRPTEGTSLDNHRPGWTYGTLFLKALSHSILNSGKINPLTGQSSLRIEIMPWIIIKAWVDADPIARLSTEGKNEELLLTQWALSAIKLFGAWDEEKRDEVMQVLSACL